MAELKTQRNDFSVEEFLKAVEDPVKQADNFTLLELMIKLYCEPPQMWGGSIIGFGSYTYKYKSGQVGTWPLIGFSPRKQNLSLYIMDSFEKYQETLQRLGKTKNGKSCLYNKKLEDVDLGVLEEVINISLDFIRQGKMGEI
jgi:hypothetical protein